MIEMKSETRDILSVRHGAIGYVANCERRMGRGLALGLHQVFPTAYDVLIAAPEVYMGQMIPAQVAPGVWVLHLIAHEKALRPLTDCEALAQALAQAARFVRERNLELFLPVGLGCGKGGGADRHKVERLLAEHTPEAVLCDRPAFF